MISAGYIQVGDIAVFNNDPITSEIYYGVVVKITGITDRTVEAIVPDYGTIKDGIDKWNDAIVSDMHISGWHYENILFKRLDHYYGRSIIIEESAELDALFSEMKG